MAKPKKAAGFEVPDYQPTPDLTAFLKATVLGKKPMMEIAIEGEPGCGKTLATRYIHKERGLSNETYLRLVCTKETTFQDFTVEKSIKDGDIVELESKFLQLLSVPSTIVVDEYGLAQPDVLAGLNSMLDYDKSITLPNGKTYVRHPECIIVFTSNPRSYAGTKRQHGGFLDRLPTLQLGYAKDEHKILKAKFPDVESEILARLVKFAQLMRNAKVTKGLQAVCSTRGLETMSNMIMNGATLDQAVSAAIKPSPDEENTVNELCKLALNAEIVKNETTGEDEISLLAGVKKELKSKEEELKTTKDELTNWKARLDKIVGAIG